MRFDINKLRSWGLRYLVSDPDGQIWAHEDVPVRESDHWRISDKFLPPTDSRVHYHVDPSSGKVIISDIEVEAELSQRRLQHYGYYARTGRTVCCPVSDVPFSVRWEDKPYDLVSNGIISEKDLKKWPVPPHF